MKKLLFKLAGLLIGKFLAKRFGYGRHRGYGAPYYDAGYDPYYRGHRPYEGGFFRPYKYKRKKSKFKKLMDMFD